MWWLWEVTPPLDGGALFRTDRSRGGAACRPGTVLSDRSRATNTWEISQSLELSWADQTLSHYTLICLVGICMFHVKTRKFTYTHTLLQPLTCASANFFSRRSRSRSVCCRRLFSSAMSPFRDARAAKWSCGEKEHRLVVSVNTRTLAFSPEVSTPTWKTLHPKETFWAKFLKYIYVWGPAAWLSG